MSLFEILLALNISCVVLLSIYAHKINANITRILALLGLLIMLVHFLVDMPRWEMLPVYIVGLINPFALMIKISCGVRKYMSCFAVLFILVGTLTCNVIVPAKPYLNNESSEVQKWIYLDSFGNKVDFSSKREKLSPVRNSLFQKTNYQLPDAQQPVLVFSNADEASLDDYVKLITELADKGYTVMSFGPPCNGGNTQLNGITIQKQSKGVKTIDINEFSSGSNQYSSYRP